MDWRGNLFIPGGYYRLVVVKGNRMDIIRQKYEN